MALAASIYGIYAVLNGVSDNRILLGVMVGAGLVQLGRKIHRNSKKK